MSINENKPTPGLVHLNIFHYDPAPDGSGLEPMGMSYIFPFKGDAWGAVNKLCEIFDNLTPVTKPSACLHFIEVHPNQLGVE